jgi:hypothetical protein
MTKTQPALRSIPNAEEVAGLIAQNATAVIRTDDADQTAPHPVGIAAE